MIFLILALYLKYKKNMSLRLQMLRLKVRVKKTITNLRNKEKVDAILERVRQKKALRTGTAPHTVVEPSHSITQRMKVALKSKVRLNNIINKVKGIYSNYKVKKGNKENVAETTATTIPLQTQTKNINPALIKQKLKQGQSLQKNNLQSKIKNKIQKVLKDSAEDINTQTCYHDENKHLQNQNNQMP